MKKSLKLLSITFFIAGFLLYSGCASTSTSERYNEEKETPPERSSNVRFSSEETTNEEIPEDYVSGTEEYGDDDSEELPDENTALDLSEVMDKISATSSANISADISNSREKILMEIIKYLNTPYKYGGTSKSGIDCSAFTQAIYNNTLGIPLLRSARDQYTMGIVVDDRQDLEFGDLVFFNTRRRVRPGHVGIYIGDNLFAHSSSKNGVIVSSLDHEYYSQRFMGGRRIEGKLNARL